MSQPRLFEASQGGSAELSNDGVLLLRHTGVANRLSGKRSREIPGATLAGVRVYPPTRLKQGFIQFLVGDETAPELSVTRAGGDELCLVFSYARRATLAGLETAVMEIVASNRVENADTATAAARSRGARSSSTDEAPMPVNSATHEAPSERAMSTGPRRPTGSQRSTEPSYSSPTVPVLRAGGTIQFDGQPTFAFGFQNDRQKYVFDMKGVYEHVTRPKALSQKYPVGAPLRVIAVWDDLIDIRIEGTGGSTQVTQVKGSQRPELGVLSTNTQETQTTRIGPDTTIFFKSAGGDECEIRVSAEPATVRKQLAKPVAALRARQTSVGGADERLARLSKLADLRDRGVLTEAEFESEKSKLLT